MKSATLLNETSFKSVGAFVFLLATCSWIEKCHGDLAVVPNSLSHVEGNNGSLAPFFIEHLFYRFEEVSMRYQQVYNASEFSPFEPGGGRITTLWFRWDHEFAGAGLFITNIQINLSTTSKSADNLSMVFSENVGPDDVVVIGPGPLEVTGGGGGASPSPFTIRLDLDNPFDYNPSAGNLLLDVRNYTGGRFNEFQFQALDAQETFGDGLSVVYAKSVDTPLATGGQSIGLITQFEFTPIPEPTIVALVGLSAALWAGRNWSRGSRRRSVLVPSEPEPE